MDTRNFVIGLIVLFVAIAFAQYIAWRTKERSGVLRLVRNEKGRLHNTNGPAIEFEDGTALYYVNGMPWSEDKFWEKYNTIR